MTAMKWSTHERHRERHTERHRERKRETDRQRERETSQEKAISRKRDRNGMLLTYKLQDMKRPDWNKNFRKILAQTNKQTNKKTDLDTLPQL